MTIICRGCNVGWINVFGNRIVPVHGLPPSNAGTSPGAGMANIGSRICSSLTFHRVRIPHLVRWYRDTNYIISLEPLSPPFYHGTSVTLQWRHNEPDCVSNNQPHDCLLNRLFRRRSKKTSKLRFTGLCAGNSPRTGEFPAQRASNTENVSIWWRHHETTHIERQTAVTQTKELL